MPEEDSPAEGEARSGDLFSPVLDQLPGLMSPSALAIVGASANPTGWSGTVIQQLQKFGFQGQIYPVNPKYDELQGLTCYPDVASIPGQVDAALLFVPRARLAAVLEDCGKKGVKGAIMLASGFSELGEEGAEQEAQLRDIAIRHRIAICGPNCLGLANLGSGFFGLTVGTYPEDMAPGRTALISQSGQLLMVLFTNAHDRGANLRYLVSTGNELNVEAADYARIALADPEIASVAMVLEGLKTPERFVALSDEAAASGKPLIVLKLGRSERAARTALAHTGKLAGSAKSFDALCRQKNIVSVDDPFELSDVATLFETCPSPGGGRISVVSFSGGWCGVIADQAEAAGLPMADFDAATMDQLKPHLEFTPPINPLDMSGNVVRNSDRWRDSLRIVANDPNTDILVVFLHQVRKAWRDDLMDPVLGLAESCGKPVIAVYDGGKVVEDGYETLARHRRLPIFRGTQPMLKAVKKFVDFHDRKARGTAARVPLPGRTEAEAKVRALLAASGQSLAEDAAKEALSLYGLPMVAEHLVDSADAALQAAEAIGYPVAMKGLADGMEHKTEAGLVHLDLNDKAEIRAAHKDLSGKLAGLTLGGKPAPCLVQKMVKGGVEVILGMQNDPDFGPMILVGLGGILTELVGDVALRPAPLSEADVAEMIDETRLGDLLRGYRGVVPADRAALEQAILHLSDFAIAFGDQVQSIDINPVKVLQDGQGCVAVDALIVKRESGDV